MCDSSNSSESEGELIAENGKTLSGPAVWVDEDDEAEVMPRSTRFGEVRIKNVSEKNLDETTMKEHQLRLREHYKKSTLIGLNPKWARIDPAAATEKEESDREVSGDEELSALEALQEMTRSTGKYIVKAKVLPRKYLASNLLRDVTIGHSKGQLSALKFHPFKPVLITATGGTISLFELCKSDQDLALKKGDFFLQDVHLPNFPITSVDFYNGGLALLASSSSRSFSYSYDLMEGKVTQLIQPIVLKSLRMVKSKLSPDGALIAHLTDPADVHVFHLKTMEHLHAFRAQERLVDFCFSPTESVIYSLAENGAVYTWDVRIRGEQSHFVDDGCVRATCLGVSANGQFIACGSNTGIVNVYNLPNAMTAQSSFDDTLSEGAHPKPIYTLSNLTTSASFINFSGDGQLMTFGSSQKYMAGRMLHCASGNIFQNFPARQEMFSREHFICADFSPCNAFFAFGTKSSKCRLYRFAHFENY